MNVRTAILLAAQHIEARPTKFDFMAVTIPADDKCGTPACALGWIGAFGRVGGDLRLSEINVPPYLGLPNQRVFYERMWKLGGSYDWRDTAPECARVLRLYAEKYHPAPKTERGIPESVRAIFAESVAA